MQGAAQQGFAKAAGTAEKDVFVFPDETIDQVGLVDIYVLLLNDVAECLYPYGIGSCCHSHQFVTLPLSYEMFLEIRGYGLYIPQSRLAPFLKSSVSLHP